MRAKFRWEHEVFVLDGSFTLSLPDEDNKKIKVKKGDVIFIPRGEAHGFSTNNNEECTFLVGAPVERPPVENIFLCDEQWEYIDN